MILTNSKSAMEDDTNSIDIQKLKDLDIKNN